MSSKNYLNEIEQIDAAFKSQDPELLDVVFEINGKKIYADKLRLSLNSSIFKSMLSDSRNKAVEIKKFSFADFKEFLTFIHSGECKLTDGNIFVMVEIAEFYQSEHFKKFCNEYLSKMVYHSTNIFQLLNIYNKYSMDQLKKPIHDFIIQNFSSFVKSDRFLNAEKFIIKEIVTLEPNNVVKPEDIFQAVFQWGENQAQLKKRQVSIIQKYNMNDAIKAEIKEFLPFIEFKKMNLFFLTEFVVQRCFLFSSEEMSEILKRVDYVKVKVTNDCGQSIYGYLPGENSSVEIIKSLKNREAGGEDSLGIYWDTNIKIPSTPSPIMKRDGVKWYLFIYEWGSIAVGHHSGINGSDYLLAEMYSESNFFFTPKCKIEIE